ncbi:MAG: hypothetical protein JXB85_00175 [Anaerolineales bacterium]|nr:hypothetical protein [Anaerolineales bacterium]
MGNPDKVVPFTLVGETLCVNLTGMLEALETIATSESGSVVLRHHLAGQVRPLSLALVRILSRPVHVGDVRADLDGERLEILAWPRAGGLRLAPIRIRFARVDNPEAAAAFVAELDARKSTAAHPGRLIGPLDYWLGWTGLILGLAVVFRWVLRKWMAED